MRYSSIDVSRLQIGRRGIRLADRRVRVQLQSTLESQFRLRCLLPKSRAVPMDVKTSLSVRKLLLHLRQHAIAADDEMAANGVPRRH